MKVKIKTRQVYHRYAEVEIDVHDMECNDIHEYLLENEHLYTDEIDDKISKAEYIWGNGRLIVTGKHLSCLNFYFHNF